MYVNVASYANHLTGLLPSNHPNTNVVSKNFTSAKEADNKMMESVVTKFKRMKPESSYHVDQQLRAGRAVLKKNGVENVSREDMTMEEYKQFFTKLMDSIPFDYSQKDTTEIWSITEEGWEQMKKDPDYEAWVLGYTAENRSVQMPQGRGGFYCVEKFGASIQEHEGYSYSKSDGNDNKEDEESWWEERRKRMKEYFEEQNELAIEKKIMHRKALARYHVKLQIAEKNGLTPPMHPVEGVGVYESIMDLFGIGGSMPT